MPIFVIFVFAAVVFGAGAMLSPVLPSHGPRIGLAAAFTTAFVLTGSLFYASLFGWNTLVIDYLWFAMVVGIFLAGTMSAGMYRAEAAGGTKQYSGWPGPRELTMFAVLSLIFIVPALIVPVPLDTDGQGFGYLALMLKLGGSFTTLSPFHPEVTYLYSPGFPALVAYLGTQLNAGLHTIQMAVGAVLAMIFVWTAYDFGNEIANTESRRTGIAMALCAVITTGLLTAYLDSHFTALLGLVFALAFLTFVIRYLREGRRIDFFGAAVCLAGMPLAQPDMTIVLMLGYVPWLATMWLVKPRPTFARWLGLAIGIPLLALIGLAPWLAKILPLLGADIRSPFEIDWRHVIPLVVYNGGVIVVLAIIGIVVAVRRGPLKNSVDLLMLVWLLLVIDFSSVGIVKALLPWLPILKYDYPFSVAWHGPIIPYMYFGSAGLLWILDRIGRKRVEIWLTRWSLTLLAVLTLIMVGVALYSDQLVTATKSTPIQIYGAFSSRADVQAMLWLRDHSDPADLILNHPGDHEGDWAPIVMQRNTVYFRPQPFFQHMEKVEAMWQDFYQFWLKPNDPANEALLRRYDIRYVIVPQIVTKPETLKSDVFRWRPPVPRAEPYLNPVYEQPYLKLVQDFDGAQVYEVVPKE
ncbi:MAG: hypothetical protein KF716_03300 [Anaerolineae bacterium]|nr:hypothetical protein [Anaerolineae bacterium]